MNVLFVIDGYIIEPLGIAYLSACLKDVGHETSLAIVPEKLWLDEDYWGWKLRTSAPDMVCFSVTTGRHQKFRAVNEVIKRVAPTLFTLAGGPHCTFFPEYALEGFDAICMGEGYEAIVEVADMLQEGGDVGCVRNISTARVAYSPFLRGPLRPLQDMDSVPFPDREIVYQQERHRKNPIRSVMASGCCFMHCTYCYAPGYRKLIGQGEGAGNVQKRDPNKVVCEVQQLTAEYGASLIYFQDDIFPIFSPKWLEGFCEAYSDVRVPFHIQTRAEFITDNHIAKLRKVGLHGVTFAIESADPVRRAQVLGRHASNDLYRKAARILRSQGVRFRVENMLGTPGETYSDCLETLDLNIELQPDVAWASLFQPYPGTVLGDSVAGTDIDSLGENFFEHAIGLDLRIQKLQKLFGLVSWLRWMRPLVGFLVRLPFSYRRVYSKVKHRLYRRRLYNGIDAE